MKLAVLILLVANLVLFIWLRWMNPQPQAELQPIAPAGKQLELVSPLSALPAVSVTPAATLAAPGSAAGSVASDSGVTAVATTQCLVWGPLPATVQAAALVAEIVERGGRAETYMHQAEVTVAYRVELGGFADAAAAERTAQSIRKGGVKDLFLRTAEDGSPPTLSLGVFRDRAHAESRATRVRALGFEPQISAIRESRTRHYLQVQAPLAASVAASLKAAGITGDSRPAACIASAADSPP